MFDVPLRELSRTALEITSAPDDETLHRHLRAALERLREEARATTAHLVVAWGRRPEQEALTCATSPTHDADSFAVELERCASWSELAATSGMRLLDGGSAPDDVADVLKRHEIREVWVVGAARSMPGLSHAVFGFGGVAPELEPEDVVSLGIRCTMLASRSLGRLAPSELEAIFAGAGSPVVPSERSSLFETDPSGRLVRWPLPLTGDDHSLPGQVVVADRGTVGEAVAAILAGSVRSYELVVRCGDDRVSIPVRVLARRSPLGGVEGMLLPPEQPVAVLPDDIAGRLTQREREVAQLLAGGLRLRQVAERLYLSHNTVRNHLKSIFTKLDVSSQQELIARIVEPSAVTPSV